LRVSHPRTPVIMFSSLTELGAAATLDALSRGASDFFAKPGGTGGLEASRKLIRDELVPAIRALCRREPKAIKPAVPSSLRPARESPGASGILATNPARSVSPTAAPSGAASATAGASSSGPPSLQSSASRVDLLAIGASTGGPNALTEVFAALPADFPVPIVVVQHMPPMFTQFFAEQLAKKSRIPTVEAKSGAAVEPGGAWLAPGDFHLTLVRDGTAIRTKLSQEERENACRPAVDPLLRSVAHLYGRNCLTVILTGMGQDGLRGCEAIRAAGGQIIVQDEATSVVWGMPGAVAKAGLADKVMPLSLIAGEIVRRVRHGRG
ncbi:MAG TPA: chemotaxis-specific protein-glutamate methyltransferase CheB, partial [Pirellulales bacterium]